MAGATPYGTLRTTGLVARLPLGQYASFEWSPDGQHFSSRTNREASSTTDPANRSRVRAVRRLAGRDPPHLGNGHVASIDEPYTGGPTSNSWWSATATARRRSSCRARLHMRPLVDWYENGQYVKSARKPRRTAGRQTESSYCLVISRAAVRTSSCTAGRARSTWSTSPRDVSWQPPRMSAARWRSIHQRPGSPPIGRGSRDRHDCRRLGPDDRRGPLSGLVR